MRFLKLAMVLALSFFLAACGGHEFEGKYKASSDLDELMGAFGGAAMTQSVIELGSDYLVVEGEKTEFKDIYVEDGKLVFEDENGAKENWKIIDDKTIVMNAGFMNVKLTRID